jgi:hypothetical protein
MFPAVVVSGAIQFSYGTVSIAPNGFTTYSYGINQPYPLGGYAGLVRQ